MIRMGPGTWDSFPLIVSRIVTIVLFLFPTMATFGRYSDRLPVLAHRHQSKAMNMAARHRRQQETANEIEHIHQRHIQTHLRDTNSPVDTPLDNTQPTPSPHLSDSSPARQRAYPPRSDAQSPPIEKLPETPLATVDGKQDAQALPGVNQADPGQISNPMPGKNQPQPSVDAAAALLSPGAQPSKMCKTVTTYWTMTMTQADPTSTTSGMNTGFLWPTATTSRVSSSAVSSTMSPAVSSAASSAPTIAPLPSFSTFILFSGSENIREQVTTSPPHVSSSSSSFPSSSSSSPQSINTPLALTTSSTLAAALIPTSRPTPSNIASSVVGGSSTGLSPLSRSLFVLFGVLGAITMLIAVAVFYMARRNRKRQEQADRYIEDVPFESSKGVYDYESKPPMSADMMHGLPPFLTESERNIVRRAATQDGQPEVHIMAPGARLHEAINSFIAKSRRLTYKISP